MGNNASSDGSTVQRPVRPFSRNGALGLSKVELEKRCQPSGLYPSCKWEDKAVRRLIADGRLAARLKGTESRVSPFDRECPICFLHYSQVNVTHCCRAHVCTECYLQVRPQKERSSACPFCNNARLQVNVAQKMGIDDIQEREEEEQRVIAATIRSRAQEEPESGGTVPSEGSESSSTTFGSSLQQIMRARSGSLGDISERTDSEQLASLALTPDERRALEEEMRAQHSHPLARLVEAEAEERRIQNDREYYRTHSGSIRERYPAEFLRFGIGGIGSDAVHRGLSSPLDGVAGMPSGLASMAPGPRRARDWNQIVDAFERGGHGEVQSLDDLVVLEAAILLSMEEESRRNQQEGRTGRSTFDAASHARDGFPLVQQFLSARVAPDDEAGDDDAMQTSGRSSGRPARRRSSLLQGRLRRLSASTSARSMTEDEQMALAIAASLREFGTPSTEGADGQNGQEAPGSAPNENLFYGRQVAVGIAAEDDSAGRPAGGVVGDAADGKVDNDTPARAAVGIMVDDQNQPGSVDAQSEDIPEHPVSLGAIAEEQEHNTRKQLHSTGTNVADAGPVAKQSAIRSIESGDALGVTPGMDFEDADRDESNDDNQTAIGASNMTDAATANNTTEAPVTSTLKDPPNSENNKAGLDVTGANDTEVGDVCLKTDPRQEISSIDHNSNSPDQGCIPSSS